MSISMVLLYLHRLCVSTQRFHLIDTVGLTNETSVYFNLKRVTPMLDQ